MTPEDVVVVRFLVQVLGIAAFTVGVALGAALLVLSVRASIPPELGWFPGLTTVALAGLAWAGLRLVRTADEP